MQTRSETLAVLDRDPQDLSVLTGLLEDAGYKVLPATTLAQVERFLSSQPVHLVVKGFDATLVDPLLFLGRVSEVSPGTRCLLVGGGGTINEAVAAIQRGATDYLTKPVSADLLLMAVGRALERQSIEAVDAGMRRRLQRESDPDFLIGGSPAMVELAKLIAEVAPAMVPVLIGGQSGTGKELVARALHRHSTRSAGPFIPVNCAGLPDSLIEAELFGHVRGAFTGAFSDRPGAFAAAAGGTLFLDEIGDLSLKGQGNLLRVLEDGVFFEIGSMHPRRADARVVAATHRHLPDLVRLGRFREDLYYRLSVVELRIPALRERAADIAALVDLFMRHFCARHKRPLKQVSPAFMQALHRYPWPGNVRELRNLIERLVLTARGSTLTAEHAPAPGTAEPGVGGAFAVVPGTPLADVERRLIEATLAATGDNRAETARLLGLSRRALYYKLNRSPTGRPERE